MPYSFENADSSPDHLLEQLRGMITEAVELRDEVESLRKENRRLRDAVYGSFEEDDVEAAFSRPSETMHLLEFSTGQLWLP